MTVIYPFPPLFAVSSEWTEVALSVAAVRLSRGSGLCRARGLPGVWRM